MPNSFSCDIKLQTLLCIIYLYNTFRKSFESPIISSYFASKEPDFGIIFQSGLEQ